MRVCVCTVFDKTLNGDIWPYPSLFFNYTGLSDYYNVDQPVYPANPFVDYLNRDDVKAALHVPNAYRYSDGNSTVEKYLLEDWMRGTVKAWVETMLDSGKYRIMFYSGQNDLILAAPACQNFLFSLQWSGASAFAAAQRNVWRLSPSDSAPAGYATSAAGLTYVTVRGAGHLLPQDQPERGFDMITRFIDNQAFHK